MTIRSPIWSPWLLGMGFILGTGTLEAATAAVPDPVTSALEQLRAANQARADHAREVAAWTLERQRLQALLDATRAETARLEREVADAGAARDAARTRLADLGGGDDLESLRTRLAQAGERLDAHLTAIAAQVPPGVVPAATDGGFDAAVRRLEVAERAASMVAVEVVTGMRDGRPEVVKVLRAAGAVAWWVSLDGCAAGSLHMDAGTVRLVTVTDEATRKTIMTALAQAEGRAPPTVTLMPSPVQVGQP